MGRDYVCGRDNEMWVSGRYGLVELRLVDGRGDEEVYEKSLERG